MKVKRNKVILIILAVILLGVGAWAFWQSRRESNSTVTPQSTASATPSPGQPGNPGDEAKGNQPSPTPTPSASPSPVSGPAIMISDFAVNTRPNGQIHTASMVAGTTSGTCTLELVSPSSQTRTVNGEVTWSGTYYICGFGTVSGITEKGIWNATLSASAPGKTSNNVKTTFSVGE